MLKTYSISTSFPNSKISHNTTPKEYTSDLEEYLSAKRTSGADLKLIENELEKHTIWQAYLLKMIDNILCSNFDSFQNHSLTSNYGTEHEITFHLQIITN